MCGCPSSTVTSGRARSAGNTLSSTQPGASPSPRRACTARNSRSGLVTQTTSAGRPSSPSRSAAASASGTSAPSTASVTAGSATRRSGYAPATTWRRRRSRAAGSAGTAASAWSTGRVDSRRYAEDPPGRPSWPSAASRHHSASSANAGSQLVQPGCSRPIDGVVIDWCAPPSGASVTPDGVPTRIDCPPA